MSTGNNAVGTIDPTGPYCKTLPVHAKPGTKAIPPGLVQLVVTDNTGAQDGPFVLRLAKACPKVPDAVPTPQPKAKTKPNARRRRRPGRPERGPRVTPRAGSDPAHLAHKPKGTHQCL